MLSGRIDIIGRDSISGWVVDFGDPSRVVEIAVFVGGVEWGRHPANRPRSDLRALGIYGEGNHGFAIVFAPPLSSNEDHELIVRPVGGPGTVERGHFRIAKHLAGNQGVTIVEDDEAVPSVIGDLYPPRVGRAGAPRYVLHVGPHKTGTTYLQMALYGSRDELRADGVLYPDNSFGWVNPGGYSHADLHRDLTALETTSLAAGFGRLNASDCNTILLSSEDLVGVSAQGLHYLNSLVAGRPIDVVFYCRRWSELLPSAWQETVKPVKTHSLGEFLAAQLADPMKSNIINFDIILNKYAEVFGVDSIRLVSYNDIVDAKIDLFDHFVRSVLRLENIPTITPTATNQSLNPIDVETVRLLNEVAIMRSEPPSVDIFQRYWRNRSDTNVSRLHEAMAKCPGTIRLNDASSGLRTVHDFISKKYRDCLIDPNTDGKLFVPAIRDLPFVQSSYLLSAGTVQCAIDLYEKICSQPSES